MTPRSAAVWIVAASVLTLFGCGTLDNLCFPNQRTGQVPLRVYGGIEADLNFLTDQDNTARIAKDALMPLRFAYVADLPLSLAGDTATLPITLSVALYAAVAHRNQSTAGSPGVWPSSIHPVPLPPEGVKIGGSADPAPASVSPSATR